MDREGIDYSEEMVLVVDDDKEFGVILINLLAQRGFNSHHVASGSEALKELKKEKKYTFLIADIVMPEMDGLELTRRIKNEYPDICVIVITGYSNEYKYVA